MWFRATQEEVLLNSSVVSYTAALEAFATPDDVVSLCAEWRRALQVLSAAPCSNELTFEAAIRSCAELS